MSAIATRINITATNKSVRIAQSKSLNRDGRRKSEKDVWIARDGERNKPAYAYKGKQRVQKRQQTTRAKNRR